MLAGRQSAGKELESEPPQSRPVLTQQQQAAIYGALAAVDPVNAQALVRYWEAALPTWATTGWDRVAKVKAWCDARQ